MKNRVLSYTLRNGCKIPSLGLGTWQADNEEQLITAVDAALEIGYRHFDTAFAYNNESILGKIFKKWISNGKLPRQDLFVTSKLPPWGVRADKVERFLRKSLENLQLDYIDLYLVHVPFAVKEKEDFVPKISAEGVVDFDMDIDLVKTWKEMERMVDLKLTKSIGVSNFNIDQLSRILKISRIPPANLQIEHHILLQQKPLVDFCRENQISVTAYSPLGTPGSAQIGVQDVLSNATVKRLSEKYQKTPAQIVIRYIIQNGLVVIPKSVQPTRLRQNFDVFDFEIDGQDLEALRKEDKGQRLIDFEGIFKGVKNHPEYPFKQV